METALDPDLADLMRSLASLALVVGLILVLSWFLKRYGFGGQAVRRRAGSARRLEILETLAVDARHRLLLVRRDSVEHLILVGASGATLVERAIPTDGTVSEGDVGPRAGGDANVPETAQRSANLAVATLEKEANETSPTITVQR